MNKVIKPDVLIAFKTSHKKVIKPQFAPNNKYYDKMFEDDMINNVSSYFPLLAKQSLVGNRCAIRVSH